MNSSKIARNNISLVFYPNGITIDNPMNVKKYKEHEETSKYGFEKKSKLLIKILNEINFENNKHVSVCKRLLPNGYNEFFSITDAEYEALKKEFNL